MWTAISDMKTLLIIFYAVGAYIIGFIITAFMIKWSGYNPLDGDGFYDPDIEDIVFFCIMWPMWWFVAFMAILFFFLPSKLVKLIFGEKTERKEDIPDGATTIHQ